MRFMKHGLARLGSPRVQPRAIPHSTTRSDGSNGQLAVCTNMIGPRMVPPTEVGASARTDAFFTTMLRDRPYIGASTWRKSERGRPSGLPRQWHALAR
jgi:hypothetical protein